MKPESAREEVRDILGTNLFFYDNIEKDDNAVIFIVHGLAEYAARYEKLAVELKKHGFGCAGFDLPGHGKSANGLDGRGIWPDDGLNTCIEAIRDGIANIKKKYNKPVILLGHSLGSFLAIAYIEKYGSDLKGCILSGTNDRQPPLLLSIGKIIAVVQSALLGAQKPSRLMNSMSFGSYNSHFKPNRTEYDWLSRNTAEVDKYVKDDFCGFIASTGLFKGMLDGLSNIYLRESIDCIPKELPIYVFSGEKDPVGNFGEGPSKLVKRFEESGILNVELKLYDDARHECINEIHSGAVMNHIVKYCKSLL